MAEPHTFTPEERQLVVDKLAQGFANQKQNHPEKWRFGDLTPQQVAEQLFDKGEVTVPAKDGSGKVTIVSAKEVFGTNGIAGLATEFATGFNEDNFRQKLLEEIKQKSAPHKLTEAARKAMDGVYDDVAEKVKLGLQNSSEFATPTRKKEFFESLGIKAETPEEEEKAYKEIARRLIEDRGLTFGNKKASLEQLGEQFRIPDLADRIPTKEQVKAIGEAVDNHTSDEPLLKQYAKGASFFDLLFAFFDWWGGGMKGGITGLFKTIGNFIANGISNDIEGGLTHAGMRKDIAQEYAQKAYDKVVADAGVADSRQHQETAPASAAPA